MQDLAGATIGIAIVALPVLVLMSLETWIQNGKNRHITFIYEEPNEEKKIEEPKEEKKILRRLFFNSSSNSPAGFQETLN